MAPDLFDPIPTPRGFALGHVLADGAAARDTQSHQTRPIGFMAAPTRCTETLLRYQGDGHLITIGPTGSGKTRSAAIPALLEHPGPAIVLDVKGELWRTTARHRHDIGQQVYCLDPWQLVGSTTDALNPLDLLHLPGEDVDDGAQALAMMISGPQVSSSADPFWEDTAHGLNSGLIAYVATSVAEHQRSLSHIRRLFSDDFEIKLAKLLDGSTIRSELARQEFGIFLQHPADRTRPSVQSTAQRHMRLLGNPRLARAMDRSTIALQDLIDGVPMTLYIVFPADKLESHRSVLRLWLGVILHAMSRRRHRQQPATLMLIDEAAQLGHFDVLKRAITLLRGYGVQTWSFWQDLSQLRHLYPQDWATLLNNAGVLPLLQPNNLRMAEEYAGLLGHLSPEAVLALGCDEALVLTDTNRRAQFVRRLDYLQDKLFQGRWDADMMFATSTPPASHDGMAPVNRLR